MVLIKTEDDGKYIIKHYKNDLGFIQKRKYIKSRNTKVGRPVIKNSKSNRLFIKRLIGKELKLINDYDDLKKLLEYVKNINNNNNNKEE